MGETKIVPACSNECRAPNWHYSSLQWCGFEVQTPTTDWRNLDARAGAKADSDKRVFTALEEVSVYVVQEDKDVAPCLAALYDSMRDPIIGIDTEWKPDSKQAENDVAMIQLASCSCVVLIRTCCLGGQIPQPVIDFCKDEEIVGVGFHWDASDELKMLDSFDKGREDLFSHFVDVRIQAEKMGYADMGVNSLAKLVLGFEPPQSKHITMSNWESSLLNARQIRYAAMDALVTGDVFRALRQLHANPTPCPGCPLPLGQWPGDLDLRCRDEECKTKKSHSSAVALLSHMRQKGHASDIHRCASCKRVSQAPPGGAAASSSHTGSDSEQPSRGATAQQDRLGFLNLPPESSGGAVPLEEEMEARGETVTWSVPGVEVDMNGRAVQGTATYGEGKERHAAANARKDGRKKRGGKKSDHRMYAAYNQFS